MQDSNKLHLRIKISRIFILLLLISVLLSDTATPAFAADETELKADKILSGMTMDEKIAQMMVVSMPQKKARSVQSEYQFGGYILFARDFKRSSRKGLIREIAACQDVSDTGMLIGVDEEGGTVVRASYYKKFRKSKFRSPRQVYRSGKYKAIEKDTRSKDRFLKSLGINCNFGPVADVAYKKSNFMYARSFGTKASKVSKFVRITVGQMDRDNMVSVLKHFPGYGKNGDTHGKIIRDKRSFVTFLTRDLRPFNAGIDAGADMIMLSHTVVNAFDKQNPASLSKDVHSYIRDNMGFDGVLITDGLGMKGVTEFAGGDQGKAAVLAVQAGNDMICATGNYSKCFEALKKAVKKGTIDTEQIDASVKRILIMKIRRGIIE